MEYGAQDSRDIQRTIPHNKSAEEAILGALLIDPECASDTIDQLTKNSFFLPRHKVIFAAMQVLNARHEPIDLIALTSYLREKGLMDLVGGFAGLTAFAAACPTTVNLPNYIKLVKDAETRRRIIELGNRLAERGSGIGDSTSEILDEAEKSFMHLTSGTSDSKQDFIGMADATYDAHNFIEAQHERVGQFTGVPTGFYDLDNLTGGLQPNNLIILAARPSIGKSTLAMNIAANAAGKGFPVAVVSLEMSSRQLTLRLMSAEHGIRTTEFRRRKVANNEWTPITFAMSKLSALPIYLSNTPSQSFIDIRAKARRIVAEKGIKLLIIDYLQLINAYSETEKVESRQQEISKISRALKLLAIELDIPIMTLSQLSRTVESRSDKHPQLSDLRESGCLEQDSDMVLMMYRESYYDKECQNDNTEVEISKQRDGPLGMVELHFNKVTTKFTSLLRDQDIPNPEAFDPSSLYNLPVRPSPAPNNALGAPPVPRRKTLDRPKFEDVTPFMSPLDDPREPDRLCDEQNFKDEG